MIFLIGTALVINGIVVGNKDLHIIGLSLLVLDGVLRKGR